jgi:hypothetical protein
LIVLILLGLRSIKTNFLLYKSIWAFPPVGLSTHTPRSLKRRPVSVAIPNANKAANAKAQPPVHRSLSASGLIRQPQAQVKAQPKVGSERSREFSFGYFSFGGQKNGGALLRAFENKQPKKSDA